MKKLIRKIRKDDGFTLLEMSIVILIVAALLLLIIPNIGRVNEKTSATTEKAAVQTVETQIVLYKMENAGKTNDEILEILHASKEITPEQYNAYQNRKK